MMENELMEKKALVVNDRRHVPADAPAGGGSLMETLASAVQRGLPVETLNALMDFQERHEAHEAKKAFVQAKAKARGEFKPLLKKHSGYSNRYKHEKLDDVCEAIDEALSKHGLSYEWFTEDLADGQVKVTCVLTHEQGHSQSNSLSGDPKLAADAKANMNGFQRKATAITYLQRMTLKTVAGIAAGDDDDTQSIPDNEPEYDTGPWTDRLIDAADLETLNKIAADLKAAKDIPPSVLRDLRSAWAGKRREIEGRMGGGNAAG